MSDENPAPDQADKSLESSPEMQSPEPINAPERRPPANNEFQEARTEPTGYERSTLRLTWVIVGINLLTCFFVGLQWHEMKSGSADTRTLAQQAITQATQTTNLAGLAQKQVEMTRQQLAGTMAATVRFVPDISHIGLISENEVAMVLVNDGKVFSPNVQLDLTATRVSIPDLRVLSQLPRYSETIPQLPPGQQGAGAPYKVLFKLERDFSLQKESIKFEGTLRFGDGFDDRFEQRFCFVYVGAFSVKTDVGSDTNGSDFVSTDSSCDGLRERLQRAHAYLPKQQ